MDRPDHTTPADTLDTIRDGGTVLLTICHARLEDTKRALEAGHFSEAQDRASELAEKLRLLAFAETNVAAFSGKYLVRAEDVEEGTHLTSWGTVVGKHVEEVECATPGRKHVHVTLKFDDGSEHTLHGDQELLGAHE
jgi:hypothetical protein